MSEEKQLLLKICLLVASYLVMFDFLWTNGQVGKLLFLLYVGITFIALFMGTLVGLIISLFFLFVVGSILLYNGFQSLGYREVYTEFLTIEHFVFYGVGLLIADLISGSIQEQHRRIVLERNRFRQEVKQFVAVDPDTSFDNRERMEIEIKREMNRVIRYGGKFTFLVLELDYYQEFLKTYGRKEVEHLMKVMGEKVRKSLRFSDRKYRYRDNKFAFLLMETGKDKVEIVADKLAEQLRNHQLLNGKTVTLTFHISFEEYHDQMKEVAYLEFVQEVDRETVFYAL
ncbi:GGDEF domain-containing protein [Ornithinibacillus sp. BX22]|uniref:GGDEF domain-containing protein n=2 Tax=Ornithinibacillus TaxID=484508 RepID=A0A923L4N3_9BACI|nr:MULTISPECIES: GGDEF domain-containing protein [Ornithinibacillus]MBC5636405.1 GGDEF domain-containing protein [Ornithinibacillus hominis]MBS3680752.1 GGDEF domain-containing protein [Ornithinibacillus massiliensis]